MHTVTNAWEPTRDVLDTKQNKVGTTIISKYDYAVNAIGQRTGVTTTGTAFPALPSWLWGYDTLGQVTSADSSVTTSDRAYQYDAIGNRKKSADGLTLPTSDNYTSNVLNQYSSLSINNQPSTINPSYDFDGNATAYPLPVAPTTLSTLVWDAENRMVTTTVGSAATTYLYDAQSRRIAKTTNGTGTVYLYDSWNCIAEYTQSVPAVSAVMSKTRLWGMDLSGTLQGAGGVTGFLSETINNQPSALNYFPTYDGNGNISEYLASNGTTTAHFEYDPFGNTVVNTDTSNQFSYRFSTKPKDAESGLYYYGYRYYDAKVGRWPSRDPIQELGGLNLYAFVENDGINKFDLLGLFDPGTTTLTSLTLLRVTGGIAMRGTPHGRTALIGFSIGLLVGEALAPLLIPEPSDIPPYSPSASEKEKAEERKAYKKFEHESKPTSTGDEKTDLCAALKHAEEVLKKREDFGTKWFNDGDHDPVNGEWKKRIENIKKELAEKDICCDD